MFYSVAIRKKSNPRIALETGECTQDEINNWCKKAKRLAIKHNSTVLVEFQPREKVFEVNPDDTTGTDSASKRTC